MKTKLIFYPNTEDVPEMVRIEITAENQEDSSQFEILRRMGLVQSSSSSCHSLNEVSFCLPAKDYLHG